MREILFKAKRIDNGAWVEGYFLKHEDNYYICPIATDISYGDNGNRVRFGCWFKVCPETVCQYTGLKDSNGNKVWENDIIRFADKTDFDCYIESLENPEDYDGCDYSDIFTVSKVVYGLEYDYPAFDLYDHHFDCNGLSGLICDDWHFEVIGNCIDNPELLGV